MSDQSVSGEGPSSGTGTNAQGASWRGGTYVLVATGVHRARACGTRQDGRGGGALNAPRRLASLALVVRALCSQMPSCQRVFRAMGASRRAARRWVARSWRWPMTLGGARQCTAGITGIPTSLVPLRRTTGPTASTVIDEGYLSAVAADFPGLSPGVSWFPSRRSPMRSSEDLLHPRYRARPQAHV
jgi:hypothetical protein